MLPKFPQLETRNLHKISYDRGIDLQTRAEEDIEWDLLLGGDPREPPKAVLLGVP